MVRAGYGSAPRCESPLSTAHSLGCRHAHPRPPIMRTSPSIMAKINKIIPTARVYSWNIHRGLISKTVKYVSNLISATDDVEAKQEAI